VIKLHYEGIKETENTRIEKDDETKDEIEMLYSFGVVIFEHVIIESEQRRYSICYFAPEELYDIVIEDKQEKKVIRYDVKKQLDNNLEQYYGLNKNDTLELDGVMYKCTSHSVEYTL